MYICLIHRMSWLIATTNFKSVQGLLGWVLLYLNVSAAILECQNIQRTQLLVFIAVQQLLHA